MFRNGHGESLYGLFQTRLLVPKNFIFPSVLANLCGVVPGIVDKWHHLILQSLEVILKLSSARTTSIPNSP